MIVLDAYAVLAFLKGETAAPEVRSLLEGPEPAALTVLGVAEVLDHLIRIVGVDEEDASLDLAQLDLLDPVPVDGRAAAAAGRLRARWYHRTRRAVSLADCIAAETTRLLDARLATSDPHLLDVCHAEAIDIHRLTASDGMVWQPPM
ncbi:MAG: PIN domain-containing protein [Acidimicrobiales bacterium]